MSAMLEMTNTRRLKRTHYGFHSENLVLCLMMPVCHEHLITSMNIWLCCLKSMTTKNKLNLSVERSQRHLWVLIQVSGCICFVLLCVQTLPLQTSAQNEGQCQLCWLAKKCWEVRSIVLRPVFCKGCIATNTHLYLFLAHQHFPVYSICWLLIPFHPHICVIK